MTNNDRLNTAISIIEDLGNSDNRDHYHDLVGQLNNTLNNSDMCSDILIELTKRYYNDIVKFSKVVGILLRLHASSNFDITVESFFFYHIVKSILPNDSNKYPCIKYIDDLYDMYVNINSNPTTTQTYPINLGTILKIISSQQGQFIEKNRDLYYSTAFYPFKLKVLTNEDHSDIILTTVNDKVFNISQEDKDKILDMITKGSSYKDTSLDRNVYVYKPIFIIGNRGISYLDGKFVLLVEDSCVYIDQGLIHRFDVTVSTKAVVDRIFEEIRDTQSIVVDLNNINFHKSSHTIKYMNDIR